MSNIISKLSEFPDIGNIDNIYIDTETGAHYRWNNIEYVSIIPVAGELYSASMEKVLGSSKNIYDFKQLKNQQDINDELLNREVIEIEDILSAIDLWGTNKKWVLGNTLPIIL